MQLNTLKKRADFVDAKNKGESCFTKGILLQVNKIEPCDEVMVGFTVTKKIGNAVIRNRVKRRFRALARDVLGKHANPAYSYVLISRRSTLERGFIELKKDLKYALRATKTYLDNSNN